MQSASLGRACPLLASPAPAGKEACHRGTSASHPLAGDTLLSSQSAPSKQATFLCSLWQQGSIIVGAGGWAAGGGAVAEVECKPLSRCQQDQLLPRQGWEAEGVWRQQEISHTHPLGTRRKDRPLKGGGLLWRQCPSLPSQAQLPTGKRPPPAQSEGGGCPGLAGVVCCPCARPLGSEEDSQPSGSLPACSAGPTQEAPSPRHSSGTPLPGTTAPLAPLLPPGPGTAIARQLQVKEAQLEAGLSPVIRPASSPKQVNRNQSMFAPLR